MIIGILVDFGHFFLFMAVQSTIESMPILRGASEKVRETIFLR